MHRLFAAALGVAAVFVPVLAAAQTITPSVTPAPQSPTVVTWYGEIATGVATAAKAGGVIDGEVGTRVWRHLDASVELGWFSTVVDHHRTQDANALTTFIAQTQGQVASASVKAPAVYATANGRWTFDKKARYRPYGLLGVGIAHISPKTSFKLGGTDISSSIGQYGITLGQDLGKSSVAPAMTVGAGVLVPYRGFFIDASLRLTPIFASHDTIMVKRVNIGVSFKF